MEKRDWIAESRRAAAAMLAVPDGSVADSAYQSLVDLLAAAYRDGAMAGLECAKELIEDQS